jgi:hypothetical protein
MDRISAAGNLTIEMSSERWRLIGTNGSSEEEVLLEAATGEPLHYPSVFAAKRRLPDTGSIPVESIQRVVLGWSHEDESWHLGLLLGPELAEPRGSRWCEIARWPDPETTVFSDIASQAGRALAHTLARPFNLIQPKVVEEQAPAPPPPLPELPIEFDTWRIEKNSNLKLVRASRWARSRMLRIVWYTLLVVVYLLLSMTSLTGIIALPKPEFLPYLGLVTAALLILMIFYLLYQVLIPPDTIVIDSQSRLVRAERNGRKRWEISSDAVESVYASEFANIRSDRNGVKRVTLGYGEMNLRLRDGSFRYLFSADQKDSERLVDAMREGRRPTGETVAPLTAYDVLTDMEAAASYLAGALGVPCVYDQRPR